MKVYVDPPAHMSRAMFRQSNALKQFAPSWVEIVHSPDGADIQLVCTIGADAVTYLSMAKHIVAMQHCTNKHGLDVWQPLWDRALMTWSHYDLRNYLGQDGFAKYPEKFCHLPLGVDDVFVSTPTTVCTRDAVMTSGYVNGPGAEAIEDLWCAAEHLGLEILHLGPQPIDLKRSWPKVKLLHGISDIDLAAAYDRCLWVSGLRYIESFELPVIEGMVRGARPICFRRDETVGWFGRWAVFVPESSGDALVNDLILAMTNPQPVLLGTSDTVAFVFDWKRIATRFWDQLDELIHLPPDSEATS